MKNLINWFEVPVLDFKRAVSFYSSIISFIGLVALCGWTTLQGPKIKQTEWLVGTWENKTQRGSIYETWAKVDEMTLSGKSYMVKGGDTIVFETIQLIEGADGLSYVPTVKNQNSGQPVAFTLTKLTATEMVFENPEHDFPQKISYTLVAADSLVAEISGINNGQERKKAFPMKRLD